jgi:gluconate 2-dehydrogenase gamma chain
MDRRKALTSIAQLGALGFAASSGAAVLTKETRYPPGTLDSNLPVPVRKGGNAFLTAEEAKEVAAIFDRLIPADELGMSASDAGCVTYVDRQLAGPFGKAASVYRLGPIKEGTPQQGPQMKQTPAERYRTGLASLGAYCKSTHDGKLFSALSADEQDDVLRKMEAGKVSLTGTDGQEFFALLLQGVQEGYLADPIYGGNKDMVGWKMIGFPGARYDYRPYVMKKGMALNLEPVGLLGNS